MHTFSCKGIQEYRQCCHQCFTFTGLHFGDASLEERDSTDDLYIVMPHRQHAPPGLADQRVGLDHELRQGGSVPRARAQPARTLAQLWIGLVPEHRAERVHPAQHATSARDLALAVGSATTH